MKVLVTTFIALRSVGKDLLLVFIYLLLTLLGAQMVSILIISPVGTSLFRNFSDAPEFRTVAERRGVSSWASLSIDDPKNEYDKGEICKYLEDSELMSSLVEFMDTKEKRSCAELAGFYEILEDIKARYGVPSSVSVALYSTATCNSYIASKAIAEHLKRKNVHTKVKVVKAIRSEEDFDEGLASLVDVIADDVITARSAKKDTKIYVNATPGFKPEASFIVLIALLLGVDSIYYIHEAFKKAVKLPALPISIERKYLEIAKRIADEKGVELDYVYRVLGLSEAIVKYLEDRYVVYEDGTKLKLRRWVYRLLELNMPEQRE